MGKLNEGERFTSWGQWGVRLTVEALSMGGGLEIQANQPVAFRCSGTIRSHFDWNHLKNEKNLHDAFTRHPHVFIS